MEFFEVVSKRFSSRAYMDQPVEKEKLDRILEAARLAPTACNRQPFKIVVVKTIDKQEALSECFHSKFIYQAPLIIGIFAKIDESWVRGDGHNFYDVDAAIVFDHLILAAAVQGLGTCWIGSYKPEKIKEFFGLAKEYEPVAFTPLGYSSDVKTDKGRKAIEDLVAYF
ncbi:MAG: nitroreductase family protein [Bacillota bacterium]